RFVSELTPMARLGLLMLLALVGSVLQLRLRLLASLGVTLALSALFLGIATMLFTSRDLGLPLFAGTLQFGLVHVGHVVANMVTERRTKERIKGTFETYMDPRIVATVIQQSTSIKASGEKQVATVFFS